MADSGAVRQARLKLHRAGDHTSCKRGNCPVLTAEVAVTAPGRFAVAVEALIAGLGLDATDGRWLDLEMVRALAPAVDQGSTAAVKQVRDILEGVPLLRQPGPGAPPDSTDIARANHRQRRAGVAARAAAGEFDNWPPPQPSIDDLIAAARTARQDGSV